MCVNCVHNRKMLTRRKCYNSKDKKINCLDGVSDLSVFALIMLAGQLNIF